MIHFQTCLRQTLWPSFMGVRLKIWSLEHDPFSDLCEISSRQTFCPSFMTTGLKMWPLEGTHGFSNIWPSDLVFDPTWPIFKLVGDFIKTNILTKFYDYQTKMWPLERTQSFSKIWPSDLVFLHDMTHFSTSSEISSRKIYQVSWLLNWKCGF